MTNCKQNNNSLTTYHPSRAEIDALINRASGHQLGKQFLVEGALDAVAATFNVHAFVVDAARESLNTPPQHNEPKTVRMSTGLASM